MTRKDYKAVARRIQRQVRNARDSGTLWALPYLCNFARSMADYCEQENPHGFDREMFLRNSGIES